MESNSGIRSRLPVPKSVFRSMMIDPRSISTSTGLVESSLKATNSRMSSTCAKPPFRQMTNTSKAIRSAVRLGPHPYLSSIVRPTLSAIFRPVLDVNTGTKQVVTRLDFDSDIRHSLTSPNTSTGTDLNVSNGSKVSVKSPPKSPAIDWDSITKEAEVMSLKTNINRLEGLLEESKVKTSQKSVEYELKIEGLVNDIERERIKSSEADNQMKVMERKCDDLSLQLNNAREEFAKEYQKYEKRINELNRTIVELNNQLSDIRSATESTEALHRSIVVSLEHQIQSLQTHINQNNDEKQVFEKQIQSLSDEVNQKDQLDTELTTSRAEIRLLSEELQSYKDGLKLSSILENELQELKGLREENKELRQSNDILSDVHSKNLILEEKIIGLESQIRTADQKIKQSLSTELEIIELRNRLQEWEKALASDSPSRVSAHLSELQTNELVFRSELGTLRNKLNELMSERNKFETDLTANKRKIDEQNDLIKKLNRKCLLFAKEKDSYKRLISSYEQDVTIDWNKVNDERVFGLETTVEEYRNLCEQLETEVRQLRSEHKVDEYNKKISELEDELRRYKELAKQFEAIQISNPATSSPDNYRVIHFKQNPVSFEYENQKIEFKRISEENLRLSTKLQLLESGCDADITRQLDEGVKNRQEVEKLEQQLKSAEKNKQTIIDAFKRSAKEFREVCWRLTGFRIDLLKNNTYRLSHVYSESPEDQLMFELEPKSQSIKLLENQYTRRLSDSVNIYLTEHDSYPGFLASLTLDLFHRQTIVQNVQK